MENSPKSITNSIAHITSINNQTVIIVAGTFFAGENSITSLGGAIGDVQSTDDLNKLLNEAAKQSYQNMQIQMPNLSGFEGSQNAQNPFINSTHLPAQNLTAVPAPKPSMPKQVYSKPHSTTKTASPKQQELIQKLCNEQCKDINEVLAIYDNDLSTITSAEANEIIQKMKSNH